MPRCTCKHLDTDHLADGTYCAATVEDGDCPCTRFEEMPDPEAELYDEADDDEPNEEPEP